MKKIFSIILASIAFSSCVDTVILPYSKTTDENYWKTKDEVSSVIAKADLNMSDATFMRNLIIWSDYRSDECVYNENITEGLRDALVEMYTQNTQPTNTFANWASLYSTINYCNIVLEKAGQTMSVDPAYTEDDYKTHRSQVLALRSLCYFYRPNGLYQGSRGPCICPGRHQGQDPALRPQLQLRRHVGPGRLSPAHLCGRRNLGLCGRKRLAQLRGQRERPGQDP